MANETAPRASTGPWTQDMKIGMPIRRTAAAFALAIGAALPGIAAGQVAWPASATRGQWHYGASIYVYLPTISGETTFPTGSSGAGIHVSGDQIIDSLKFAFMGTFEAHNGHWGAFTDVIYLNVGGDKSRSREFSIANTGIPAGTSADLGLDIKGWVWTLAGEYRLGSSPEGNLDLLVGARMFDVTQRLNWSIYGNLGQIDAAGRSGSSEVADTLWDGVVGVKGRYAFGANREWFVPYYLDVGAGESKLTWQAAAGLGYSFRWGELVAMWRYLDYDLKSESRIEGITFNGPMVGAVFHW